ncbi:MAG: preprotein translocase subunit YajC [Hymenobacteraceae bacterium]|nr:preprotein translocase subunit YajC [Hymenobacteraceae bacterium]MDX5395345.1 preprotein translocase subunit YajC [Hymenobacteraceae bacterium]MDX5511396.1 preprotein translocase subunit YajC [Hymenobacteraceae bacterium]
MYSILLQAPAGDGSGLWSNLIFIGAIILVFYLFMIRPQQKKMRDQKQFREDLKKGMMIVTIGGLHGKLVAIHAETIELEVDRNLVLTVEKSAVSMEATNRINQPQTK